MQLLADQTTLVIAGAWNPAILVPQWVAQNALDLQVNDNFEVGVQVTFVDANRSIRFSFEGIDYLPGRPSLTFYLRPAEVANCEKAVTTASRILQRLVHTPVTGFGFNFAFQVTQPSPALVGIFGGSTAIANAFPHEDANLVSSGCSAIVSRGGRLFIVNAKLEGGNARFDVNVHRETSSAAAASEAMAPGLYQQTYGDVVQFMQNLTGEQLG